MEKKKRGERENTFGMRVDPPQKEECTGFLHDPAAECGGQSDSRERKG